MITVAALYVDPRGTYAAPELATGEGDRVRFGAMITVGSLFAGIGGLELGLGWALAEAGIPHRVAWQVEREPFPRSVLARHWPEADRSVVDVCEAGRANLAPVDIAIGGFPCQDLSFAGQGAGIVEGNRSGLWYQFARVVRELRPWIVVVENVGALLSRGVGIVLGDLAAAGYDAEWRCVRASDVGAPHQRERLFIVAHRVRERREADGHGHGREGERGSGLLDGERAARGADADGCSGARAMADADRGRLGRGRGAYRGGLAEPADASSVAHPGGPGLDHGGVHGAGQTSTGRERQASGAHGDGERGVSQSCLGRVPHGLPAGVDGAESDRWPAGPGQPQEPWEAPRTAKGVAQRAARLKALGNAVVPQVAREVGRLMVVPLLARAARYSADPSGEADEARGVGEEGGAGVDHGAG